MELKIWVALVCFMGFEAWAGVDGGGGSAIVCRNSNGTIVSAELLDLYEGKVQYRVNIHYSNSPMLEQIHSVLLRIPESQRTLIEGYVLNVVNKMQILPDGVHLQSIDDSFEVIYKQGCEREQLVNYYTDDRILVDGEIWKSLSETDRAALVMHEAVYAANRLVGAKDSRRSRYAVASIFDLNTVWVDVNNDIPDEKYYCFSGDQNVSMWLFEENDDLVLQFMNLGQSLVMSKKTIKVSKSDFSSFYSPQVLRGSELVGNDFSHTTKVTSNFEADDSITLTKKWEAIFDMDGNRLNFQQTKYYISWKSGTHPNMSFQNSAITCSELH